eukprot:11169623-Lingulodinium_polyedra.AAC.1
MQVRGVVFSRLCAFEHVHEGVPSKDFDVKARRGFGKSARRRSQRHFFSLRYLDTAIGRSLGRCWRSGASTSC